MVIRKAVIVIQTTGIAIEPGGVATHLPDITIQHTGLALQQAQYHFQTTGLSTLQKQFVHL
jgi:hypothetical protein